jgi:hypothetical protein
MNAVRVPWSDASFLAYFGGLTILAAVVALLSIESNEHAAGALVGLSALIFAVVMVLALVARRGGRLVTAGLYALTAVVSFVIFFGALLDWFGWLPHANGRVFEGFRFWLLALELSAVVAAAVALRAFHFPLLVFVVAATGWFFVTDLLSNGGDWTAIVTILYGLVLLNAGVRARRPRLARLWVLAPRRRRIDDRGRTALVLPQERLRLDRDRVRRARLHRTRQSTRTLELGRARRVGPVPGDHPLR